MVKYHILLNLLYLRVQEIQKFFNFLIKISLLFASEIKSLQTKNLKNYALEIIPFKVQIKKILINNLK